MAQLDVVLERPAGDDVDRADRLAGHDEHPVALDRALLGGQLRHVAERPVGRQREAHLGRAHVAPAQLVRFARGDYLAGVHDRDPVGEVLSLIHEMGRQEHGLAQLAQRADRRPRLAPRGRVKAGRRLIEEDQLGIPHQRQRQVESPSLSAGQLLEPRVALVGQFDQLDHLIDR